MYLRQRSRLMPSLILVWLAPCRLVSALFFCCFVFPIHQSRNMWCVCAALRLFTRLRPPFFFPFSVNVAILYILCVDSCLQQSQRQEGLDQLVHSWRLDRHAEHLVLSVRISLHCFASGPCFLLPGCCCCWLFNHLVLVWASFCFWWFVCHQPSPAPLREGSVRGVLDLPVQNTPQSILKASLPGRVLGQLVLATQVFA